MNVLQSPFAVLALLAWLAAPPQSLGDAAKKEALRRQLTPKSRVALTNLGQPSEIPPAAVVTSEPPPVGDEPPPVVAAIPKELPKELPKEKDEAYWRDRIAKARTALDHDQTIADALQTRINALQRDVVNRDDPMQQAKLRLELQKALADLEKMQRQLDGDRADIKAIQDEARRLDVPAGWIR